MEKDKLEQLKDRLLAEKENIERDLKVFATEDATAPGGWKAKRPDFGNDAGDEDEQADQAEEFATELSLEQQLSTRLANINKALSKMEKGTYGVCEKCGKEIDIARLKVNPEAQAHTSC